MRSSYYTYQYSTVRRRVNGLLLFKGQLTARYGYGIIGGEPLDLTWRIP